MGSITLTNLRARVRETADAVNSEFVTDAANSVDFFINASCDALYYKLVKALKEEFVYSESAFLTVADTELVSLPADFFAMYQVELSSDGGGTYSTLKRYRPLDRNALRNSSATQAGTWPPQYRIQGSSIRLLPAPSTVFSGNFVYAPSRTALSSGSDTFTVPGDWENWAIYAAAIRILVKEESDTQDLRIEMARIEEEISEQAQERDWAFPEKVQDVETLTGDAPTGYSQSSFGDDPWGVFWY